MARYARQAARGGGWERGKVVFLCRGLIHEHGGKNEYTPCKQRFLMAQQVKRENERVQGPTGLAAPRSTLELQNGLHRIVEEPFPRHALLVAHQQVTAVDGAHRHLLQGHDEQFGRR